MSHDHSDEELEFSCGPGDPAYDEVECAAVIAEVWTLLDGECTPETRDKLRHHLEACPGCLRHYGLEERIKTLIAKKCSGDKAPESLRARLLLEISRTTIFKS
ncbi:MAG: mycothiol system anti-sigma-R factor [Mycobacteriaceae bacterium]|nr:mycothiol system anti-sigma-R factor [Mycobacteriaceae bacterium]